MAQYNISSGDHIVVYDKLKHVMPVIVPATTQEVMQRLVVGYGEVLFCDI